MSSASLSVVLITRNEAENLETCLRSVDWADEIIVYDSGSTDGTLDIAKEFTERVFVDADWEGFGRQRQKAQEKAAGKWIFMIDADERVSEPLRSEIQDVLKKDDETRVYAIPRKSWFFGRFIHHSGWYPDYVLRLYPREKARFDSALVHEKLRLGRGLSVVRLKGDLLHFTFRDLEHWVNKTASYAKAWADQQEKRGRRGSLWRAVSHAVAYFCKTYFLRIGFLDGRQGFLLAVLGGYSKFLKYADLWSRRFPRKDS